MLQVLYILAFIIIASLAIANLIRNLFTLSQEAQRQYAPRAMAGSGYRSSSIPHPELLDDMGNVINEPLLVMRSINVDDARKQLDALYQDSPGNNPEE
jgi:hypothetical protein